MSTELENTTVSSKEIIARSGISRATLNNYISLKLIPSPTVRKPEGPEGPTKMGYFPAWVLDRLAKIKELKAAGMRMAEIVAYFGGVEEEVAPLANDILRATSYQSIEEMVFPAVLVNERWEIIWINESAEHVLFKERVHEISSAVKRNLLRLFIDNRLASRFSNWKEILVAHFRLAKRDLREELFHQICREAAVEHMEILKNLWIDAEPLRDRPITQQRLVLRPYIGRASHHTLFSTDFREGTLLLYTPTSMQLEQILNLLMGREKLIKTLLAQRIPSLTPLCILAGRFDSDLHLRTALPPQEYFDLINQITLMSHHCFQQYDGTPGRSFHEGVVSFFLSTPDSPTHYLNQALKCAQVLQQGANALDQRWKSKKAWVNTLRVSIGLHCAHEWVGTVPSSLAFEFTVMGDSLMESVKLCKFADGGTIWASKKVVESLLPSQRKQVRFGIRRNSNRERFVSPGIYSRVSELLSLEELERRGLREIANLAVTEILHLDSDEDESPELREI